MKRDIWCTRNKLRASAYPCRTNPANNLRMLLYANKKTKFIREFWLPAIVSEVMSVGRFLITVQKIIIYCTHSLIFVVLFTILNIIPTYFIFHDFFKYNFCYKFSISYLQNMFWSIQQTFQHPALLTPSKISIFSGGANPLLWPPINSPVIPHIYEYNRIFQLSK